MKNRPTRTPIEELKRQRSSMTLGTLDGRIGEARLIHRSDDVFTSEGAADVEAGNAKPKIKFYNETFTSNGSNLEALYLKYIPLDNSEHVYSGGAYLSQKYWTRQENIIQLLNNPAPHIGDSITVEYAYDPSAVVGVFRNYTDWRFLNVGRTDATSYAGVDYDDSSWAVGIMPISSSSAPHTIVTGWGTPNTVAWPGNSSLWIRRWTSGGTLHYRIDNGITFYVNGVSIGSDYSSIGTESSINIPAGLLAMRCDDDGPPSWIDLWGI